MLSPGEVSLRPAAFLSELSQPIGVWGSLFTIFIGDTLRSVTAAQFCTRRPTELTLVNVTKLRSASTVSCFLKDGRLKVLNIREKLLSEEK